jgi:hypothetical protein
MRIIQANPVDVIELSTHPSDDAAGEYSDMRNSLLEYESWCRNVLWRQRRIFRQCGNSP